MAIITSKAQEWSRAESPRESDLWEYTARAVPDGDYPFWTYSGMAAAGCTLPEMLAWLQGEGLDVAGAADLAPRIIRPRPRTPDGL
jgi:hypothetical protein